VGARRVPWLRHITAAFFAFATVLVLGVWLVLRQTLPPQTATIDLPNLSAPVTVRFDSHGIPFIRARSDQDAAEALGYLHARDRMFQMDLMRRAAGGTLAELFGASALDNDEEMRRLGLRHRAEADLSDLSPAARALLQAYADGVNAWIAQRGRFAAPEYLVLGRPPPWTITDSLLWGKMMGLWLSNNWYTEMARLALAGHLPLAKIDALWPSVPNEVTEAAGAPPSAAPSPAHAALIERGLSRAAAAILVGMRYYPEPFTLPAEASNEWAISGSRSATGAPLLAGDPHLGFGFPSLWYLARIDTPTETLAGATAPGLPFIIIGHNEHVAWTFTTTGADVQDIFIEHPTRDGQAYETPTGPQPFATRRERIRVAGHADIVLTVRETRHGPVLGTTPDGQNLLAVAMANLAPHDTDADGLLKLNDAQSVFDVEAASARITSPVQNLLSADTEGNIGFFTTGKVPIRKNGDGAWPVDGADGRHDWIGFASGAALPHAINPPSGMLINANNPTVGRHFPIFMGSDVYGDWRARRIETLLLAGGNRKTARYVAQMQLDVTSVFAQDLLPRLLVVSLPANDTATAARNLLRNWSGEMSMNTPQPLIFNAWTRAILEQILEQNRLSDRDLPWSEDNLLYALLSSPTNHAFQSIWCDDHCDLLLRTALDRAITQLQKRYGANPQTWRWGQAHDADFNDPLVSRLPLVGRLGRFSLPVPGDDTTIDVASPARTQADPDGFTAIHGPELRAVFDLSDLDRSLFVIAPGQSGNLLSRHADDLLKRWRDGDNLVLGASPLTQGGLLELRPAP
jgi:penicillin G amidase